MLLVSVSAWAVSQEDFEAFFKKSTGMTHFVITSKRACTCHGGSVDGRAGIAPSRPRATRVREVSIPGRTVRQDEVGW
jgi:hypothetical protein